MQSEPAPQHPHAGDPVFDLHVGGKMETVSTVALNGPDELSLAYTPGVAEPCKVIAKQPDMAYEYTRKWNMIAVVTDGTAVLELGDIGPLAGLPVMEGKAVLFKNFAGVNVFDSEIDEKDPQKLVEVIAGTGTAPETVATLVRLARKLGKIPVIAGNAEGFIGNRIFSAYRRAMEYLVEDGASPLAITNALTRLARGELLSPASTRLMLDTMARTTSGPQRLRAGVPAGWAAKGVWL